MSFYTQYVHVYVYIVSEYQNLYVSASVKQALHVQVIAKTHCVLIALY